MDRSATQLCTLFSLELPEGELPSSLHFPSLPGPSSLAVSEEMCGRWSWEEGRGEGVEGEEVGTDFLFSADEELGVTVSSRELQHNVVL